MVKGLNDFLIENPSGPFFIIDMDKLSQIPIEEFRERYIEDMQLYFDCHPRPIVECVECSEDISSAGDLIRWEGANFDQRCFRDVYERERRECKGYHKKYLDLVLDSLDINKA